MALAPHRRRIAAALALPAAMLVVCSPAAGAAVSGGDIPIAVVTAGPHPYAAPVAEASQRFGIPELWIWRVMHAESRGKRRAVSHAGAMGLMQIMPATWTMLSARHRLGNDPFDIRANILAGAAYLRAMWDRYRDVRLMLAAYNAGPGRADAYAAGRRGLPAETIAYVRQIAPELGASDEASSVPAPAQAAPGWRDAPLFSGRAAVSSEPALGSESTPLARRSIALPPPPERGAVSANSLFVVLSEPVQ
jgi:soluble lytic murein transglycosylase-like protein